MTSKRCAIYTRKSTEEGLEQNFNSLHAQREACEAFVLSQAGEGWSGLPTAYDDGGFSGGSMERPGLQALLADIAAGKVDIVVVYKVDRLTRSLADFAKMVELFDAKGVSFVSVTQAFNTTSSMGRLTLNVLLSFAQFEREVTGERIRDKIAASKAKGLRMGGRPPLGYDIKDLKLVVNEDEAERVRTIFQRFLEVPSVKALVADLAERGVRSKQWINRAGEVVGGGPLTVGALPYMLANPAYIGVTAHKTKRYPGSHPAIIDEVTWEAVQAKLKTRSHAGANKRKITERPLLAGKVFDDRENPMIVVHTARHGRRYRYYFSKAKHTGQGTPGSLPRIASGMLEGFIARQLEPMLRPGWMIDSSPADRMAAAIERLTVSADRLILRLTSEAVDPSSIEPHGQGLKQTPDSLDVALDFHTRRRQGALILTSAAAALPPPPKPDRTLVRAMVLARQWAKDLEEGRYPSIKALAAGNQLCDHYTARMLPLAYLAPDLQQQILDGRQPAALSLAALTDQPMPLVWHEQRERFGAFG